MKKVSIRRTATERTPMTIRAVIFDMGKVLVHFTHDGMFAAMGEVCGATGAEIRRWLWDSGLQDRFERGEIDAAGLRRQLEQHVGRKLDEAALMRAASDIFTLNEPLVPLIQSLGQGGYRLVVLSNTCPPHVAWIRRHWDVLDLFDEHVFSYEVGVMKPDPAIYQAAAAAAGHPPTECFFVDDLAENVAAARELGMGGAVFTGVGELRAALEEAGVPAACEAE